MLMSPRTAYIHAEVVNFFPPLLLSVGFQVSALAGGDDSDLPAVQQARHGAAVAQTGAGGLLDGLPGGGHQERRVLGPIPCKLEKR